MSKKADSKGKKKKIEKKEEAPPLPPQGDFSTLKAESKLITIIDLEDKIESMKKELALCKKDYKLLEEIHLNFEEIHTYAESELSAQVGAQKDYIAELVTTKEKDFEENTTIIKDLGKMKRLLGVKMKRF